MSDDTEYTVKIYGTQQVYIPEGMYSIEEVENLLSEMKKVKQIQEDMFREAREEVEDWKSRYELVKLEVSFWRSRHDMLLQAMADSAPTAKILPNKDAYELGRLHGAAAECEECAKVVDIIASMVIQGTVVHNFLVASAAKIRARLKA